jgi:endonuclease/exonuclease/phosphatase family metal-dependent hydrolase
MALNRAAALALAKELESGDSEVALKLAEVVQRVRPDILLLNEVDRDKADEALRLFHDLYLAVSQSGFAPVNYPYRFSAAVNTGVPTEFDLDQDGQTGGAGDCFGYGRFPGQYGMAVLSRFPIRRDEVRTFQKFLWKDMPDAKLPERDGEPFYKTAIMAEFRLSSKSHWDVPIETPHGVIHFLVCHPTPPVFDGPEDRNGCRNHDELRLLADYVSSDPALSRYIYDDNQRTGGLPPDADFVIAGDLNADPNDGASLAGAMDQLLRHPRVNDSKTPTSSGGVAMSDRQAAANRQHRGAPGEDTADFADETTGNLRIDYVLPSKSLAIVSSGVFWPAPGEAGVELADVSDHHLVWIDVRRAR